jgi:hypothetical protein
MNRTNVSLISTLVMRYATLPQLKRAFPEVTINNPDTVKKITNGIVNLKTKVKK